VSTYLDAVGLARDWLNTLTATLVGPGNPIPLGVTLKQEGPGGGADTVYGFLYELPSQTWGGAEHASMRARLSMQVYGPTKQSATDGAIAYAELLQGLTNGGRVTLGGGALLLGTDEIFGPSWLPDGDAPRYVVDADWLFG
jgi:hypothetical protein